VCNAAETLLVHDVVVSDLMPRLLSALGRAGVLVRADEHVWELAEIMSEGRDVGESLGVVMEPATEQDWESEYLAPILAVGVVGSVQEAIEHIGRYGSGHSEAIVTRDTASARAFQLGVDAACVYVNASTRFTDGGEFGMGAEIGNSTQKLHARGPIGLRELCTFKYLVTGDGHVRG
jgi:glutamate-5-semialdehyde dehydrogenase